MPKRLLRRLLTSSGMPSSPPAARMPQAPVSGQFHQGPVVLFENSNGRVEDCIFENVDVAVEVRGEASHVHIRNLLATGSGSVAVLKDGGQILTED